MAEAPHAFLRSLLLFPDLWFWNRLVFSAVDHCCCPQQARSALHLLAQLVPGVDCDRVDYCLSMGSEDRCATSPSSQNVLSAGFNTTGEKSTQENQRHPENTITIRRYPPSRPVLEAPHAIRSPVPVSQRMSLPLPLRAKEDSPRSHCHVRRDGTSRQVMAHQL